MGPKYLKQALKLVVISVPSTQSVPSEGMQL